jgi:hypothetical protein
MLMKASSGSSEKSPPNPSFERTSACGSRRSIPTLEVVPSKTLFTLHRAGSSFVPQRLVLSVVGTACFATFVGAYLKGLFCRLSVHGAACFFLGASLRCCCSFSAWLSWRFASSLLLCVKLLFRPCLPCQPFVPLSAKPF